MFNIGEREPPSHHELTLIVMWVHQSQKTVLVLMLLLFYTGIEYFCWGRVECKYINTLISVAIYDC